MTVKRTSHDRTLRLPRLSPREETGRPGSCATAVAAEALRTGVLSQRARPQRREEIPREGDTMRVGDPDDGLLANEYVGEDTPGGSSPTPDQNDVDAIGRAYGLMEEDTGVLRSGAEILQRRDRHRPELTPPRRRR